jgi:hypothetical protein
VPEIKFLPKFVQPSDVVLDVGANHGLYAYHLSRLVGPTGCVHAFEPIPLNLTILRHTVKSLGLTNVVVHPNACGDEDCTARFCVLLDHGIPQLGWPRRQNFEGLRFECEVVLLEV